MKHPAFTLAMPFGLLLADAFQGLQNAVPVHQAEGGFLMPTRVSTILSSSFDRFTADSSLDRATPGRVGGLSRLIDELMDNTFYSPLSPSGSLAPSSLWKRLDMSVPAASSITVDVKETDKAYEVDAEVPGFKKEDIQLSFTEDGSMAITAERKEEHEEKRGGDEGTAAGEEAGADPGKASAPVWYFKERSYGKVCGEGKKGGEAGEELGMYETDKCIYVCVFVNEKLK